MTRFTIYTDKHHDFRWNFVSSDNRVIARSGEGFKKQEDCIASMKVLQRDLPGASLDNLFRGIVPLALTVEVPAARVIGPAPASAGDTAIPPTRVSMSPAMDPAVSVSPAVPPAQAFTAQV